MQKWVLGNNFNAYNFRWLKFHIRNCHFKIQLWQTQISATNYALNVNSKRVIIIKKEKKKWHCHGIKLKLNFFFCFYNLWKITPYRRENSPLIWHSLLQFSTVCKNKFSKYPIESRITYEIWWQRILSYRLIPEMNISKMKLFGLTNAWLKTGYV